MKNWIKVIGVCLIKAILYVIGLFIGVVLFFGAIFFISTIPFLNAVMNVICGIFVVFVVGLLIFTTVLYVWNKLKEAKEEFDRRDRGGW